MSRKFTDIDPTFKRHPITGDIGVKNDIEAIKGSIRNLIRTMAYERKFHPEIACRIKKILFMDISSLTTRSIKEMIVEVIKNHERRVTIETVKVVPSESLTDYKVTVYFRVNNVPDPIMVNTLLRRIR